MSTQTLQMNLARAGIVAALCLSLFASTALATDGQEQTALADAWRAFYGGNYESAVKQAGQLTKLDDPKLRSIAIEAAYIQARSYWATGNRAGRARARKIWQQLEKASADNATMITRLKIAKALELEAASNSANIDEAISTLESILREQTLHMGTPEAAIELARIYAQDDRFDEAKKALQFVVDLLSDKKTLAKMELADEEIAKLYIGVAKKAMEQLKYDQDAGRKEFEEAEKLRKEGKFAEAYLAYQAIVKDFPKTDYAPRSELHMGDCLLGLGQEKRAIDHWKTFITPQPAGPWRAQAFTKVVDFFLLEQLDLREAGKYADLARASLPTAINDEKAGDSWKAAAFDVQLRVGIVSFCEGKGPVAAEAFEAAKQLASNKETAERLDAVIEAAKTGKPVIPDDCFGTADASALSPRKTVSPSDKAALALSMGIINLIAGRLDNADDCFNRVLGTPAVRPTSDTPGRPAKPVMKGATRAQLAFATFGRGAVRHAHKQMDEAKEQFIASMKAYRDGSWHDETLYRIATIMQNNAEVKYGYIGSDSIPAGGKKSDTDKSSKPPTEKECEAAKKAEQERLATRAKAFGEVLPYWQELTERYPESPRCEPAMYNTGLLLYEIAVATDSSDQSRIKTKQAWKTALATLSRFTDTFPQSLEAGDAYVRQIDIVLEQMLDIKQSLRLIESGLAWAEAQDVDLETHADGSLTTGTINRAIQSLSQTDQSLPIWADRGQLLQPRSLLDVLYNLHLRAGILAYAQEDYDQAVDHFKAAGPAHLTDGMQGNFDRQKVGLHAMLICSQRKEPAWSREITDAVRNEQDQFLLKLADTYLHAGRPEKAEAIYRQFTESGSRSRSAAASYSRMRLALALSQDRANTDQAIEFYKSFYDRGQADYPWAADAILRLGVLIQNTRGDSAAALSHFAYVHTKYPDHPEAERAMYFHCVAASWIEDKEQVRKVAEKFLAKYPQSQWHKAVENIKKKNTP